MKDTLLRMWRRYSCLVGQDQTQETIDKENALLLEIEELLPFKNQEEHEHWKDVGDGKFWEDFKELTLSIINRQQD